MWALLVDDRSVDPEQPANRIVSPETDVEASPGKLTSKSTAKRRRPPQTKMPPKSSSNGKNGTDRKPANDAKDDGTLTLIDRAERVRDSLQQSLTLTRALITQLKRQKKASKLVQTTLDSLRQLQSEDL